MAKKVTLHFYRHGEKDKEGLLTPKGFEQASIAGKALVEDLRKEGKITVKCVGTSLKRSQQTRDQMENEIRDAKLTDAEIIKSSIRRTMKEPAMRDKDSPWWQEAKKAPDLVEFWLRNADEKATETPAEASARLKFLLKMVERISNRLESGRNVHYVLVGHADVSALIEHFAGKVMQYPEKTLGFCEKVKFEFEEGKVWMEFRGKKYEVKL